MARKKKSASTAGSGWLTTYGDMVTLMLCFFVMLYEPSEVDVTRLQALSASISGDPTVVPFLYQQENLLILAIPSAPCLQWRRGGCWAQR